MPVLHNGGADRERDLAGANVGEAGVSAQADDGTVELRIHGVSGTPVVSMLDISVVRRVAGDDGAGFWRRGEIPDPEILQHYRVVHDDGAIAERDVQLEGYRWGGLTSGAAKAALWVVFAPFALVNAAAAAHMPGATAPEQRRGIAPGVEGALVRLFALTLSFTLVLAVYISAVDVVGWQCGMPLRPRSRQLVSSCTDHASVTHFLFWHITNTPARHVVITTLVPLAVVLVIWKLASATWQRYEGFRPGPSLPVLRAEDVPSRSAGLTLPVRTKEQRTPFDDPGFWDGRERTEMLRHLHVAACFAALNAMVATVWIRAHRPGTSTVVPWLLFALSLLALGTAVAFTAVGLSDRRRRATYVVLAISGALLVATLISMWWAKLGTLHEFTRRGIQHHYVTNLPRELPGVGPTTTALFVAQLVLVFLIFWLGVRANRRSRAWRNASPRELGLHGFTSAALCMLSLVVAGLFAAGMILRVADLMGKGRPRAEIAARAAGAIVTPDALVWVARGTVLAVAVVLLLALCIGAPIAWKIWRHPGAHTVAEPLSPFARADVEPGFAGRDRRRRDRAIERMRELAGLTDGAGTIVGLAMIACFIAAALAAGFAFYADYRPHNGWAVFQSNKGFDWRIWTASAGSWLIVGFAGVMLATMLRAYRNPDQRRTVGIIWDLATFWPRCAHPWAPPCYAERTVPEYAARATFLRYGPDFVPGDKVVLSAHSQGSIIAAATVLQLGSTDGIGLVSYGCPLDRLYAKYFPAYFGDPTLPILHRRLHGAWRNLSRMTDPIGGPVKIPGTDAVDVDVPIPTQKNPGDDDYPAIEGHSRYPREKLYAQKLLEVRDLI